LFYTFVWISVLIDSVDNDGNQPQQNEAMAQAMGLISQMSMGFMMSAFSNMAQNLGLF